MAPDPDHSAGAGRAAGGGGDLMERAVDGAIRLGRAWKALSRERRLAAIAAAVLWLTLFLPWYQASVVGRGYRTHGAAPVSDSLSGWAAFGLVQALLLIVSLGVLVLLFLRAEGRAGNVLGGDGRMVTVAGGLSVFLVIIGLFDAPSPAVRGQLVVSTGLEWGIFLALLAAAGLTWAGRRIGASLEDDPFLSENRRGGAQGAAPEQARATKAERSEATGPPPAPVRAPDAAGGAAPGEEPTHAAHPGEEPTRAAAPGEEPTRAADAAEQPTRASGSAAAAAEPLTAAGGRSASDRSGREPGGQEPPENVPEAPDPAPRTAEDVPEESETAQEESGSGSRSSWRPAERPNWTDPERPVGWLTAPPKHQRSEDETE